MSHLNGVLFWSPMWTRLKFPALLILCAGLTPASAWAYEIEGVPGYQDSVQLDLPVSSDSLSSPERQRRFDLALDALGIPKESEPSFENFPPPRAVNRAEVTDHLPAIDPDGALGRYLSFVGDQVLFFSELYSSSLPSSFLKFVYPFKRDPGSFDSDFLMNRLYRIALQVKQPLWSAPLSGLKIVIDPGHMGTPSWDETTGKFVKIGSLKVSEGNIALLTSLLLAESLETLGAEIILTRQENGTVANTTLENFDVAPHLNQYFYNSLDSWMRPLFSLKTDAAFLHAVKQAPETLKAYSDSQRTQFFISGEDLEARSTLIDQVHPDIVIDVHFDAGKSDQLQSGDNTIEAFVPGGIRTGETGSKKMRSYHLKHLLETRRWNASVGLASSIIGDLSQSLNLPLQNLPEFLTSIRVKDGVYARNLYLNRRNLNSLMVYLECLHYDHVDEFKGLTQNTEIGSYRGRTFRYPARLNPIVSGIRSGILRYFKEMF